jgi:hypothetical protein
MLLPGKEWSGSQKPCRYQKNNRLIVSNLSSSVVIGIPHEVFRGGLPWLADAFAFDHFPDRKQDDFDIQPEGPVIHIPDIQGKFVLPGDGVAPVDLRPTR